MPSPVASLSRDVIDTPQYDHQSIADCIAVRIQAYFEDLNGQAPCHDLYQTVIAQVEKPLIHGVLEHVNGNKVKAAEILGMSRNTLLKKMKLYNL